MKRNSQFVGQRQRTVRYTLDEWQDPAFRRQAFINARRQADAMGGEIIIKVQDGRRVRKVASIKALYKMAGRSYIKAGTFTREYPLDKPAIPND